MCQDRRGYTPYFTLDVADTICREMNFKQASRWTLRNSFDIQSNYSIHIKDVQCSTEEWESCYFYEDTSSCEHSRQLRFFYLDKSSMIIDDLTLLHR